MPNTTSPIDEYLAKHATEEQAAELNRIRAFLHTKVAGLEETISYGIPTYKYKKHNLIHMAAFKDHMSIFPGAAPVEELKQKLTEYKTSKGTIQFTMDRPIPDQLLQEILDLCIVRAKK